MNFHRKLIGYADYATNLGGRQKIEFSSQFEQDASSIVAMSFVRKVARKRLKKLYVFFRNHDRVKLSIWTKNSTSLLKLKALRWNSKVSRTRKLKFMYSTRWIFNTLKFALTKVKLPLRSENQVACPEIMRTYDETKALKSKKVKKKLLKGRRD